MTGPASTADAIVYGILIATILLALYGFGLSVTERARRWRRR